MDGRRQREALAAAERSLVLLGAGQAEEAVAAARRSAELDQIGAFTGLPGAVSGIVAARRADQPVPDAAWDALAASVGPGPLGTRVGELRG